MAATVVNDGLDTITRYVLKKTTSITPKLGLYTNTVTITTSTTMSNLTETTLAGYSRQELLGTDWTGGVSGGVASYTAAAKTFNFSFYVPPSVTITGYFVIDEVTSKLLYAENFTTSFTVPLAGGSLSVIVTYKDQNC